jgi:hypothetical protein
MSSTAERRKSDICGSSLKTVGKAFQVKLVRRMFKNVCKAVIKAKGGYLDFSKIFLDFNTSGYYIIPYVLFNSVVE